MSGEERKDSASALTIDRAAFLLLRVKRVFRKKKQQRKEQKVAEAAAAAAALAAARTPSGAPRAPPPLLRSRTLPAIVVPGISILQAQIDSRFKEGHQLSTPQLYHAPRLSFADTNTLDPRRHLAHHRLSSPETTVLSADLLHLPSSHQSPRLSTGSATLGRLAKLIKDRTGNDNATRRLSWETECEESMSIPRSSSIDSMVSIDSNKRCNPLSRRLPSPLLVPRPLAAADRPPPPLSPSVARRLKGPRAVTG